MKFSTVLNAIAGATIVAATPVVVANTKDQYSVENLTSAKDGDKNGIAFTVVDLSTSPSESATCFIKWTGSHVPRGPVKCSDPWFAVSLQYFDDTSNFGLNINHAYGETCADCNQPFDEDYNGIVGSCEIMVDDDRFDESASSTSEDGTKVTSKATRALLCPVDFDD